MDDESMWEMIREAGTLDLDSVKTSVDELNKTADNPNALSGEDENGYWQNIVQALFNNSPGDETHDYISQNLKNTVFDRLKREFGPDDVEMPEENPQGGRRRRARKTRRRKSTKKSTRRRRMRTRKH